ncbi:MAG: substrate-binding domain-containing protein [Alphaproteobacteria bacterium]|jgi:accessory colonization factor AcfC|nr:substrate-binding domain-containing protein [Alphaproteobacteria bacterium]MBU1547946.1 substrate-binding domain-containing protein [Alphaproteobacteria bacterium]MBU2336292.1 substrate-binding domain-containing protein [Alphaproteobacteria bacterium]MBU2390313.1 substrate-binding domain-containing protein [Alphaproteobacteria bacterium]MDY6961821.1 substrate-binding domain-containing protein [Pseudomonadota bacterium]
MQTLSCYAAIVLAATATFAHAEGQVSYDPSIQHQPKDNVVRLYGAGGPHTAFQKVADLWMKKTGDKVEITAGPEASWSKKAQADADIIWGTAEHAMTAFLQTYRTFSSDQVLPIYIRPTVIAVQKGNPKQIHSFEDLLKDGIKIVVTEGAGVANTSGTGTWEDVAGRLGSLSDVRAFRKNIVAFSPGSGASFKAFAELGADAWITWPNWPATKSDVLEEVPIAKERQIWRDVSIAVAPDADQQARDFAAFLETPEAAELMKTEGWTR